MESALEGVINHFAFSGEFIRGESLKCGNINDTYITTFKGENGQTNTYILQRINHNVFKEPNNLMENVMAITRHIRKKVIKEGGNPARETLNFVPTLDGKYIYKCKNGNYWRAYNYIDGVRTYQVAENPLHVYNAGKAFGRFQKLLSDFPAHNLHVTIPDFHHTPKRYKFFLDSVKNDAAGRVEKVKEEIEFVKERENKLPVLVDLLDSGELPLRVTHNDTKFNNVLIDDISGEGVCVIDLDTVMPGTSLYDFGDSIRSGANTAEEDEKDLSKVSLDMVLFEEYTRGFLEMTYDFLNPVEIENLPFSAILITLELGMRFLTDYINGDVYFKTRYENHNLDRARVQFKLAADMEEKYNRMTEIVQKYVKKNRGKNLMHESKQSTKRGSIRTYNLA